MRKLLGWIIAGLVGLILLGSLTGREPSGQNWHVAGRLDGDNMWRFVRINSGFEQNRVVYDDAANQLCGQSGSPSICFLHFFANGDVIPPNQPRRVFFENGGFKNYPVLASYARNRNSGLAEFSHWDCRRAGSADAPLNALCGPGVSETYNAVLTIASRTSMATSCVWPKTDDISGFERFLATVADVPRREQYRKAFAEMNTGRGPDDRADCNRLRDRIETQAREARGRLGIPQPPQAVSTPAPRDQWQRRR